MSVRERDGGNGFSMWIFLRENRSASVCVDGRKRGGGDRGCRVRDEAEI